MTRAPDLTGSVFGLWRVLRHGPDRVYRTVDHRNDSRVRIARFPTWYARCVCGTEREVRQSELKRGLTLSCGCLHRERTTAARTAVNTRHGHARKRGLITREYRSWVHMRQRCTNPLNARFAAYGGRGITVAPAWEDFAVFLRDMGPRPPRTSLDRIDNDGPYSPSNCRWATFTQQQTNRSGTVTLTYCGETRPLTDWARSLGLKGNTLRSRIQRGWSIATAIERPAHRQSVAAKET